jgi:hypothetical protein
MTDEERRNEPSESQRLAGSLAMLGQLRVPITDLRILFEGKHFWQEFFPGRYELDNEGVLTIQIKDGRGVQHPPEEPTWKEIHSNLDILVACFISEKNSTLEDASIMDLIRFSKTKVEQ